MPNVTVSRTTIGVCTVCKGAGGCPGCRGERSIGGKRCLICRGNGNCPLCGQAFDPAVAKPTQTEEPPKPLPAAQIPLHTTRVSSTEVPVTVTRWTNAQLTLRAVLALLILVGFYAFSLGVVAFLGFVTWVEFQLLSHPGATVVPIFLLLPPLGALLILLAIMPRGPRLGYPGRGLNSKRAPELFTFLRDVAKQTGQRMPRAVYLFDFPNAVVFDRGLFLGRAIGLGLPFFDELTVDELRAVVAHEFGHYANRTGPITTTVYRATRTFAAASAAAGTVPFLDGVFEAWTEVYLRLAMPISRQYELRCDEVACRIAGTEAVVSALTKISNIGGDSEIANPVAGWEEDLHSTHPPLRDRVAMARALNLPTPAREPDARPATVLLESLVATAARRAQSAPPDGVASYS
jgi:Zn-dependent protease with chaperone function